MRRLITRLSILLSVFLFVGVAAPMAYAQDDIFEDACKTNSDSSFCDEVDSTSNPLVGPDGTLVRVANILLFVAGAIAVVMIIIGGLKYIISSGDPNNTKSAKNTILYAIIGLVAAVIARPIITFVIRSL